MKKRTLECSVSETKKKSRLSSCSPFEYDQVAYVFQGDDHEAVTDEGKERVTVSADAYCHALSGLLLYVFHEHSTENRELLCFPTIPDISAFITKIFFESEMEYCCGIIAVIYIVRAIVSTRSRVKSSVLVVDHSNWRSLVLSSLLVASKLNDDGCMSNRDFADIFEVPETDSETDQDSDVSSSLTLSVLNQLEIDLVMAVDFCLLVSPWEYNIYAHMMYAEIMLAKCLSPMRRGDSGVGIAEDGMIQSSGVSTVSTGGDRGCGEAEGGSVGRGSPLAAGALVSSSSSSSAVACELSSAEGKVAEVQTGEEGTPAITSPSLSVRAILGGVWPLSSFFTSSQ